MTTTTTDARLFTIWVTALYPNVDHAVTDDEMAARNEEDRGDYHAVCGAVFLPAPDTRAPGWKCPTCVRFVRARATLAEMLDRLGGPGDTHARHARATWWGRLFGFGRRDR